MQCVQQMIKAYIDLCGHFPYASSHGNEYIVIAYHYDINCVLGTTVKNDKLQPSLLHGENSTTISPEQEWHQILGSLITKHLHISKEQWIKRKPNSNWSPLTIIEPMQLNMLFRLLKTISNQVYLVLILISPFQNGTDYWINFFLC